jgi:integrase
MAAYKWQKTNFPGVRYREHPTRKHGVKFDRYYAIRYQITKELNEIDPKTGKKKKIVERKEEGLGWTSQKDPADKEFWTEKKAALTLERLQSAAKHGAPKAATRISEQRQIEQARREKEKTEREQAEKENITFGQFMTETYLPQCEQDKRPKTYEFENMFYKKHLADDIGGLTFPAISSFQIEKIKKTMKDKKLSPRYIQYALQIIRQVFNKAHKLGIFNGESPTKAVDWPKLDNAKMRYLSIAETETLLKALADKSKNLHDMALLSLHCGLRFGEIAGLTWSCVNLEQGTIAILNAKTGSRTAYLTDKAKEMLKGRKRGQANELIFPKRTVSAGTMVKPSRAFTRTVDELGFNENVTDRKMHVTFHTLRHSYATHLYEGTHDLYLTQKSLGHTTSTMTQRYAKMNEKRLREGAAAIQQTFLAGQKKTEEAEAETEEPTGQLLAFPG